MEIYVDKLPKSCEDCLLLTSDDECCINYKTIVIEELQHRNPLCPLKELSNAQVAIGWYQEGKNISNPHCRADLMLNNTCTGQTLEYFVSKEWYLVGEPQYISTNWKGARKDIKEGLRVTIEVAVNGNMDKTELRLQYINGSGYFLKDMEKGDSFGITDDLYDSTEWKVWSE